MNSQYSTAVAPTLTVPRANFDRSHTGDTTIDFDYIYPIYYDEVYPGDTFNLDLTVTGRLQTLIYPLQTPMYLDTHFFYVPLRQIWDNSKKFFGEQINPGDSIDYVVPKGAATPVTGFGELSIEDYWTLPTKIPDYEFVILYQRAYVHSYNEWFRDQNLIDSLVLSTADGPDTTTNRSLQKRGKRHDYFTSGLVSPQKNGDSIGAVELPLGTSAPIKGLGIFNQGAVATAPNVYETGASAPANMTGWSSIDGVPGLGQANVQIEQEGATTYPAIYADLTKATAATILQVREAQAIQRLLELDARAGTRYSEIVYSTFGVRMTDMTYRPEFLGGGSARIQTQAVAANTTATSQEIGDLGAVGFIESFGNGFTKSFTEHGVVIGVISARAQLLYQQGLNRLFDRTTRYDYLYPIMQNIGDQATKLKEIYCQDPATDTGATGIPDNERTFNYQERYAELKYKPSWVTGLYRSNCTASLEHRHLSEEFVSPPAFNQAFIEQNTPMDRAVHVPAEPHLFLNLQFNLQCARPMQIYSVPGMGARF